MRYLALFLLLATPVWAGVPPVTTGSMVASTGNVTVSATVDTFFPITGINSPTNQTDTDGTTPASLVSSDTVSDEGISQTYSNMFCFAGTAPGTGKSYTITPYVGINFANTCVISDTATT